MKKRMSWNQKKFLLIPHFPYCILMALSFMLTRSFASLVNPPIPQQTQLFIYNARRSSSVSIYNNINNHRYIFTEKTTKNNNSNIIMKAKAITGMDEKSKGEFRRTASTFRDFIRADESTPYTPESGRYHLIISYACPWACRWYVWKRNLQCFLFLIFWVYFVMINDSKLSFASDSSYLLVLN